MITEHQEVARYRVAEQVRAAENRALMHDHQETDGGTRHGLATALRRLADKLEPLTNSAPQARHARPEARSTGLSVVR
ncbi:hypothetical protein E1263_21345 [Kribbella antibiotica]|uniref:Uncharacterized protein n=1 Tax=Kribbella antibiotica TaxID=190195 RepID=A0A4R4ZIH5_9ACTN|nr:hypothetical protein [Kribbella antibiotica]TDD57920.1 hypothetical protein E1263_21345 [Kribbella antibiotica]